MRPARCGSSAPTTRPQPLTLISAAQGQPRISLSTRRTGNCGSYTNDEHVNFRIASRPIRPSRRNGRTVVAGSDRVYLTGATAYRDHLAISSRVDGLDQLILRVIRRPRDADSVRGSELQRLLPRQSGIRAGRISRRLYVDGHPDDGLRLSPGHRRARSPEGPGDAVGLRRVAICDRAIDGRRARRREGAGVGRLSKGFEKNGEGKLFLYAYGAYGHAIPPSFNTNRISLLDRGWACAIAHIRGGDDLGYKWFLDGKLTKRTNTFNDFVDVAKGLVDARVHAAPDGSRSTADRRAAN